MNFIVSFNTSIGVEIFITCVILQQSYIALFQPLPVIRFATVAGRHDKIVHTTTTFNCNLTKWRISRQWSSRGLHGADGCSTLLHDVFSRWNLFIRLLATWIWACEEDEDQSCYRVPDNDECNRFSESNCIVEKARHRWTNECTKCKHWSPKTRNQSISF